MRDEIFHSVSVFVSSELCRDRAAGQSTSWQCSRGESDLRREGEMMVKYWLAGTATGAGQTDITESSQVRQVIS